MVDGKDDAYNAVALSRLGQSIDAILRAERAEMADALAQRDQELIQFGERIDQFAQLLMIQSEDAERYRQALADLQADIAVQHSQTDAALTHAAAAIDHWSVTHIDAEKLAAATIARESERLKLVHQAQIESVHARRQALADEMARRVAESEAVINQLRADHAALASEKYALLSQLEAGREAVAALEETVRQQRGQLGDLVADKGGLLAQLSVSQQTLAAAEADKVAAVATARVPMATLQAELATCIDQLDRLKRNARAREALLRDEQAAIRLNERVAAVRQSLRADLAEQQIAVLAQLLPGGVAQQALLARQPDGPRLTLAEGVVWLATRAPAAMMASVDADFEVSCAQALPDDDFVAAAYLWLLARPVDIDGLAHYGRRLATRMSRCDVLKDLAGSAEARDRPSALADRLPADATAFVQQAYQAILERVADRDGEGHYGKRLASGETRASVLIDLAQSGEALRKALPVASSLRVVACLMPGQARRSFSFHLYRLAGRRPPGWQQAWQAGRLAGLASTMQRAWHAAELRLSELAEDADRRVDVAKRAAKPGQLNNVFVNAPAPNPALPAPALALLLDDTAKRTPAMIRSAIRTELSAQQGR